MRKKDRTAIWEEFNNLADGLTQFREHIYAADGAEFLHRLFECYVTNCDVPAIASAREFSECIVKLRQNYREWNQYLMHVMLETSSDSESRHQQSEHFRSDCMWIDLTEVAENFFRSNRL